jgi:hypothetical protein
MIAVAHFTSPAVHSSGSYFLGGAYTTGHIGCLIFMEVIVMAG